MRPFNAILLIGYTPESWTKALIVPIYMGGNKPTYKCDSYRPVALLPSLYKLFESVLYKRILTWSDLYCESFPCRQQQDFFKGLSCTTASFTCTESIRTMLEQNNIVFACFLDIKRAFDTIWHSGL